MRINQNIAAFNAFRNLSATNSRLGESFEELSSGFRINRAADDAAGLAKSESLSTSPDESGAIQNRLEHVISDLSVAVENLSASESWVRNTDMAEEMVSFTRHQITVQAGTAMLAQANTVPATVLSLLQ